MVAVAGGQAAFVIDAVSYLVSAVSLARLRPPGQRRPAPGTGAPGAPGARGAAGGSRPRPGGPLAGLMVIADDGFLRSAAAFLAVQGLALGATSALTAQFLIRVLKLPTVVYGLPFLLVGICGMAGSLAAARLERRLGADRVAAGRAAVEEIMARCAGLPLALAIVAARAETDRGAPLPVLAEQLRDSAAALDALTAGDDRTDLRAVFSGAELVSRASDGGFIHALAGRADE